MFQKSTHAVEKPTEIAKSPTSSHTTIDDPVMPKEEKINHAASIRRSKPQRPRGAKEGKLHRGSKQEVTREARLSRQHSAAHTRDEVTGVKKKQEQECPGTKPSWRRIVQKWKTAGQTRRPGIPRGAPGKERGRGCKCQEQGHPGAKVIRGKNTKDQRKFILSKNPALPG